jgi:nicotinamidase-related amidase
MAHILPSGGGKALINVDDTVLLLLDHQDGLFLTVKDITVAELRANVIALARIATLLKMPVITTASVPDGPNGPLMPEIAEFAPHARYVPRQGEVNAWDNEAYVKAVRETGKKTLIMAGVWTGVCVMFPALDAKAAGFNVYAVMDASGDPTEFVSRTTLARFIQAGVGADLDQRGDLRAPPHLAASGGSGNRRDLHRGHAELPGGHGVLPERKARRVVGQAGDLTQGFSIRHMLSPTETPAGGNPEGEDGSSLARSCFCVLMR